MNILIIVLLYFVKYIFTCDTFWTYLIFEGNWMFYSLFFCISLNAAFVVTLLKHIGYFEENDYFIIVPLCLVKYSFRGDTYWKPQIIRGKSMFYLLFSLVSSKHLVCSENKKWTLSNDQLLLSFYQVETCYMW